MTEKPGYSIKEFDYDLPSDLIAQEPHSKRDHSRLMVLRRNAGKREHCYFYELPGILKGGDLLVFNNTRVIPARLLGRRVDTGGQIELLLLRKAGDDDNKWETLVKPGRKAMPGSIIQFDHGIEAHVEEICHTGHRIVSFKGQKSSEEILSLIGNVPLPPYINKDIDDPEFYQTIYSRIEGSVAAPTAGFHFTENTLNDLKEKNINHAYLTLHIGPGTFRPVKTDDIRAHIMHSEYFDIPEKTARAINRAKAEGRRIIAVGTTSCRVLESNIDAKGMVAPGTGWTDIFIYPGFKFRVLDGLLTNFHLPRSTLFMLVCAFAGRDAAIKSYTEAIKEHYRFYSFGDAMLII